MLRLLLPASLLLTGASALAQDDADAARSAATAGTEQKVREIVRGYYLKSDIGSTIYLTTYSGQLSGVMNVGLTVGDDFVDNERSSVAWEITFSQNLQNGPDWQDEPKTLAPAQYIQGDMHMFGATADIEASVYPTRRFGIGIRAGGGVMVAPLLIAPDAYQASVVPAWGGNESIVNGGALPVVLAAPTIEYYTKLSHFSVGVDVEASYVLTLNDLGITPSGYMKYTF